MPLRITKAIEPIVVDRLTLCLYSPPGIGKTSTACTAEKCLLLDFDRGSYRSRNRGDVVQPETWDDVTGITQADLAPYRTLAIDTAGRALDLLTQKIIATDAKMGRGGALTLQGFGRLKVEFIAWVTSIRAFGLDVVLLCHSAEEKSGDDIIERLDMQGGSKNEIYKSADVMGRLYVHGGKRWLNFSPTDTSFGKNPGGFPVLEVPDFATTPTFLASIITETKAKLNALSAAQTKAAAELAGWKAKCDAATTPDEFTALMGPVVLLSEPVRDNAKRILVNAAKAKGFTLTADKSHFEGGNAPA